MGKEIDLELMCDLTDEDVQVRAQELGASIMEQDRVDNEKREVMKDFKQQLEEIAQRMRKLSTAIRKRAESRMVKCGVEFHTPTAGIKRIVRLDTGELVREEQMTMEEQQRHLFRDEGGSAEAEQAELPEVSAPAAPEAQQSKPGRKSRKGSQDERTEV